MADPDFSAKILKMCKLAWELLQADEPLWVDDSRWDAEKALRRVTHLLPCRAGESGGGECPGIVPCGVEDAAPCACRRLPLVLRPLLESSLLAANLPPYREQRIGVPPRGWLAWSRAQSGEETTHQTNSLLLRIVGREAASAVNSAGGWSAEGILLDERQRRSFEILDSFLVLQALFCSKLIGFSSWNGIRRLARTDGGAGFSVERVNRLLFNHANLILDLGATQFHPAAVGGDSGRDTALLELFLDAVAKQGCGLVCASTQRLLVEESAATRTSWRPDYRQAGRASYRDADNRLRFESVRESQRKVLSLEEVLHPSSFDKLVEALGRGQLLLER